MTHAFISYVRENKDLVDRLAAELTSGGATVWLDRRDLSPGARWKDEIRKAIRNGDYFLACFSREYADREKTYMNEELTLAIDALREMPANRTWFIPILLNGGRIPERISSAEDLGDLNAVDLSQEWNDGILAILRAMGLDDPRSQHANPLVTVAKNFNTPESLQAIELMGKLGYAEKQVLSVLIEATTSRTDHETKHAAVLALAKIGASAVRAMAAALEPAEEVSRKCILSALYRIGPAAAPALPQILGVLNQSLAGREDPYGHIMNATIEERAINAIWAIGPDATGAVPFLGSLLKDRFTRIRVLAAFALARIGPASFSILAEALRDPQFQGDISAGILWAGTLGHPTDAEAIIRRAGVSAALPGLLSTLDGHRDTYKTISDEAIRVLGRMGPEAAEVAPSLVELRDKLDDGDRRRLLDAALASITPTRPRGRTSRQDPGRSAGLRKPSGRNS